MDARTDLSTEEAARAKRVRKNKKRARDARLSRWGKERAALVVKIANDPAWMDRLFGEWVGRPPVEYYGFVPSRHASTFKVTA